MTSPVVEFLAGSSEQFSNCFSFAFSVSFDYRISSCWTRWWRANFLAEDV